MCSSDLDEYPNWRKLNKMKKNDSYRMVKQELILRFFAFYYDFESYSGSLASYLNDFMEKYRFADDNKLSEMSHIFRNTVDSFYDAYIDGNFKHNISITLQDAISVGIARNLTRVINDGKINTQIRMKQIIDDSLFSESALAEGLAKKQRLIDRLNRACEIMR